MTAMLSALGRFSLQWLQALALGPDLHQLGIAQDLQVLRDGRGGHVKFRHKLPGGILFSRQQLNDAPASRVG